MNFKTTAILFVLLLVIGGYLLFTREKEGGGGGEKKEHKLVDVSNASDVNKVVISAADGKKVVLQKSGKDWRMVEPVSAPADDQEVSSTIESVVSLKSNNQLDPKEATPSKTGLDKPQYTIDLVTGDGKTTSVQLGDKLAVGNSVYARVQGKEPVEVVPADVLDKVDRPASAFRRLKLIETSSLDIHQVAINRTEGGNLKLEKDLADWKIVDPVKVPADAAAVSDVLNSLTALRAVSFVERPAEASDAMQTTTLTVTFSTEPPSTQPTTAPAATQPGGRGAPITVTFGDYDLLKKYIYVKVSDSPFVAKVNASDVKAFEKKPLDLRDKRVIDLKPEEVSRVSIATEPPAATQPSATAPAAAPAASKPAGTQVVIERRKVGEASGVPFVPGSAATQPSTKPSAKLTLEDKLPKKSAWVLGSSDNAEADDADVNGLLTALHPLRVDKYLESNPATQPAKSYVLTVHTEAAGGAGTADYKMRFIDRGADQAYVGQYNDLTFEISRFTLSRYFEGDFKKKPGGTAAPPLGGGAPLSNPGQGIP
jgi:hypothetical protein